MSLIPFASILTGIFVAILLCIFLLQDYIQEQSRQQNSNLIANHLQSNLDQILTSLVSQTATFANKNKLFKLIATEASTATNPDHIQLQNMLPNAVNVRLFKKGAAKVNTNIRPPFSFTSLDLVHRAEKGETVYPEATNVRGEWLISLAVAIRDPADKGIVGTMLVTLDINSIKQNLMVTQGEINLNQSFDQNADTEFLSIGSSGSPVSFSRELINKHWSIHYKPANFSSDLPTAPLYLLLMPALVCFFLALAGTVISLLRIQKTLNLDIRLLHKQLINAIVDRFSPSTAYQFSNFEEIDSLLVKVETKARTLATLEQKIKQGEFSQSSNNEKQTASNRLSNQTDAAKSGNKSQQGSADAGLELQQDLQKKQKKTDSLPIPQAAEIDVSSIFRAYDIRGIVGTTLTNDIVTRIGLSIGTQAKALGEQTIVVAGDGRLSSPDFVEAMIQGLTESGCDVLNIGLVPTPLLYYATHNSHARSGVMITGSHNPSNYNGIKVVLAGKALVDDEIQGLYQKYLSKEFSSGEGSEILLDITEEYIDRITDDVLVAQPLKIVIDCGNGIAGLIAPDLFTSLGCEVIPLFCDIDGNFPNHHPDPIIPENLESLTAAVLANQADLGIAFDGDGDRLVAVTAAGDVVWPDKLMMLFAKDIVSRNPGADVVYDIKCSAHLNTVISEFGGRPIICRSGHSFIKAKMIATNAILGGEMSGHLCFKERWFGFDDGLYAAARLLEIIGSQSEGLAALIADFPLSIVTPEIQIPVTETNKFEIIQQISNPDDFDGATITTIDGFRVDYDDRWGLVRASNTSPNLTLRFEANDEAGLEKIQTQFRQKLTAINKNLTF